MAKLGGEVIYQICLRTVHSPNRPVRKSPSLAPLQCITLQTNSHISFTDSIELGRHFQAFLLEALRTEADNPGHEPAAGMARGGKSKRPEVPPERKVQS